MEVNERRWRREGLLNRNQNQGFNQKKIKVARTCFASFVTGRVPAVSENTGLTGENVNTGRYEKMKKNGEKIEGRRRSKAGSVHVKAFRRPTDF